MRLPCDGGGGINAYFGLSNRRAGNHPLDYRLACLAIGLGLMFVARKLWLAILGAMSSFAVLVTYFSCRLLKQKIRIRTDW